MCEEYRIANKDLYSTIQDLKQALQVPTRLTLVSGLLQSLDVCDGKVVSACGWSGIPGSKPACGRSNGPRARPAREREGGREGAERAEGGGGGGGRGGGDATEVDDESARVGGQGAGDAGPAVILARFRHVQAPSARVLHSSARVLHSSA
eukprot:3195092-Rhodomonas_salina.1